MISIIVPVYNSENTLKKCLDSLSVQDYSDIEIIAVDDGSTDGSKEILLECQKHDKRIKVLSQPNKGVSCARNRGIEMSRGEYVMFVDSDDTIQPNTCSKVLSVMCPEVDMVIFGLNIYNKNNLLRTPHLRTTRYELRKNIGIYWELRKINLGPCNKLYRKSLIKEYFDTTLSLGEDTLFVLDYMKNVNIIECLSDCLYNVSLDNVNSLNRKYRENRLEQLICVRNKEVENLSDIYKNNSDSRIYEEYFLDLHVILTGLFFHNVEHKIQKIKNNVDKFDYRSIYTKTNFSSLYYRLFSRLVSNHIYNLIYVLIRFRLLFERLLLK